MRLLSELRSPARNRITARAGVGSELDMRFNTLCGEMFGLNESMNSEPPRREPSRPRPLPRLIAVGQISQGPIRAGVGLSDQSGGGVVGIAEDEAGWQGESGAAVRGIISEGGALSSLGEARTGEVAVLSLLDLKISFFRALR